MATNRYTDPDFIATPRTRSRQSRSSGSPIIMFERIFEKAAADTDTSVLRLWKEVPPNFVPTKFAYAGDAIAGMTDVNVGLYEPTSGDSDINGAEVDDNCFADALNLAAGFANWDDDIALNCLKDVDIANSGRRLFEHAGDDIDSRPRGYDVAATLITGGANTGTMAFRMWGYMG